MMMDTWSKRGVGKLQGSDPRGTSCRDPNGATGFHGFDHHDCRNGFQVENITITYAERIKPKVSQTIT